MASKIAINRITNANIYVNGNNFLGRAEEVKLPDVEAMMADHKALGMVGAMELPSGFNKMTGEIKWNSLYAEAAKLTGNIYATHQLMCRSNIESYGAQGRVREIGLVTYLTVRFTKNPMGGFKQNENAEFPSSFSATYVRQVIGGEDVLELDVLANIYKVAGQDMLANYRANIGG